MDTTGGIDKVSMEKRKVTDGLESVIVPLYKRGDKKVTGNYREISLLCTAYKIYAEIIRQRLNEEVEGKRMLPESQTGFQKGRSTIDNIFILNHLIQRVKGREGKKEKERLYAVFVDLKAAFDTVDRNILWQILEGKGVKEGLIRNLKNIYGGTIVMVRTKEGLTSGFETTKRVRQGCVLSPLLFSLYIADLDKELGKRNIGEVELGNMRIWSLAYADNMVCVAKNKEALKDMMGMLRRFLKARKLELCAGKTKIVVFNRKKREKKEKWERSGMNIEEV